MSHTLPLPVPEEQIGAFCRRHHIRRLSLFGSVLREDFAPESDIDVLVEFAPEDVTGMIGLMTMQGELEDLFGRKSGFADTQVYPPQHSSARCR